MRKTILILVTVASMSMILNQSTLAQEEQVASKVFYAELGGGGIIMSMNFDQRFNSSSKLGFGYRLGVGFGIGEFKGGRSYYDYTYWDENEYVTVREYYWDYDTKTYYSIPVGLNYVFGKPNSSASFEVGGGVTFLTRKISYNLDLYDDKPGHYIGYLTFMFRRMPVDGGYTFRVGFTPIINSGGNLVPMGAISFGYAF